MKDWIKKDRLKFKVGSLEWMNYFGLPTGLVMFGIIFLIFVFKTYDSDKIFVLLTGFISCFITGVLTFFLQLHRLRFKSFKLDRELSDFKNVVSEILKNSNWEIDYDNELYLQATYRGSLINLDMLTLRFSKTEIRWNVIRHPLSHNAIANLITLNNQGKMVIKQIKASA
ncbi:MAG: hypothetical protein H6540_04900 [Bacteroidales bacterium]|nr:hypothetical protein [Bacteroidales bacterium]